MKTCAALGVSILLAASMLYAAGSKTSLVTFSHAVRVPGVTLPAGTYRFVSSGSTGNRSMVRITNRSGDKLFATIMTIPDYRHENTTHAVVLFGEKGPCASATPIRGWFSPNEKYGYRFIYPKDEAQEIATACNEPVPETASALAKKTDLDANEASNLEKSEIHLMTPTKQERTYEAKVLEAGDKVDTNGFDADNE